jgi:quercetin dioxygenase-like cupin family protein
MKLTRWNKETAPSLEALRGALAGEGFSSYEWTDPAGTVYSVHEHEFAEVRIVLRGKMRVGLPDTGEEIILGPGDRLDLPAHMPHWADVSDEGPVLYLCASKNGTIHHKK